MQSNNISSINWRKTDEGAVIQTTTFINKINTDITYPVELANAALAQRRATLGKQLETLNAEKAKIASELEAIDSIQ